MAAMARTLLTSQAAANPTVATYEAAIDALLAGHLQVVIKAFDIVLTDKAPSTTRFLRTVIDLESTGAVLLTSPFKMKAFQAEDEVSATSLLTAYIAANPTFFISPVFYRYSDQMAGQNLRVILMVVYCADATGGAANWQAAGGAPGGVAGGDLSGMYPNPTVVGLMGLPLSPIGAQGQRLVISDGATGYQWYNTPVYTTLLIAAAAQASQVIGEEIIIYNTPAGAQDGTYQLTAKTGVVGDYTKINDATNTASEITVVDAGGFYASSDQEGVDTEIGGGTILGATGGALPIATTTIDSVALGTAEGSLWCILLENGVLRYRTTLSVTHDDATANVSEHDIQPGPGVTLVPVTFEADISAGNLRIRAVASGGGWSYRVRRLALQII